MGYVPNCSLAGFFKHSCPLKKQIGRFASPLLAHLGSLCGKSFKFHTANKSNEAMQGDGSLSFIESSPIGKDLFEGQSQEQVAESIAQLIVSDQAESKILGLDGTWGSGKSNLVEILRRKLEHSHYFFIYDAWGHQEDIQRRSFLEELTESLRDDSVIDRSWADKLEELLSRQKKTLTKTIPRLSNGVIITFLVTVFTPIAGAIADAVEGWYWKAVITATPLFIGLIIYFVASYRAGKFLTLEQVYVIYKDQQLINETHTVIFEKEPSAREFRKWMSNLSKGLLDNKKLVVVFDNIDRLPRDKVRDIWSSIYAFFAEDSYDGIWAIVPFDRKQISTVFQDEEIHNQEGNEISREFLEKSFSIIYRVAPPVLTDWRKFFDSKFEEAFGKTKKVEQRYVRQIFDCFQKEITPRNIIAFMNEMVSLRLIAEKEIRLRYIAVFVLAKQEILKDPVEQILSSDYLAGAKSIFADDEDLRDNIAALAYHVPLSLASQVTLMRAIQISFNSQDGTKLNYMARQHSHFMDILDLVVAEDDLDIDNVTITISMLEPGAVPSNRLTRIWNDLCAKETRRLSFGQTFTKVHELLLTRCSPNRRTRLVRHLVHGFGSAEDFQGAMYYQALSDLRNCIQDNNLNVNVKRIAPKLKKSPEIFVDYVRVAKQEYKEFKLTCEESKLRPYIINKIPDDLNGLSVLSVVANDYDFSSVVTRLEEELSANTLTIQNVGPFYELYKALAKEKPIRVIESNQARDLLYQAETDTETQYDLLAMCLAQGVSQSVLTDPNEDQVNHIAEKVEYYADYGDMLLNNLDWQDFCLKSVLSRITIHSYGTSALNITEILERYSALLASLDVEFPDFMERLDDWSEYAQEEITPENILDYVVDYSLLKHATQIDCNLSRHLIETMALRLNSLSVGDWIEDLQDRASFIYKVAHLLACLGHLQRVPSNVVQAYRLLLLGMARNEFSATRDVILHIFYKRMYTSTLKSIARKIRDIYISEEEITADKFLFFARLLLEHGRLSQKSADVVQEILTPIGDDDDCMSVIARNSDTLAPIINDAGKDAKDFKNIVRRKFLPKPSVDEKLGHLARLIKVKRRRS